MELERLKSESSLLTNFVSLEAVLDRAQGNDIVESIAENESRFDEMRRDKQFLASLRGRLFRLGYLKAEKARDGLNEALTKAIQRFQEEAGLTVDGWIGTQSWDALQELFAFEPSTVLETWIQDETINPAMQRAISLRLISLGFGDDGVTRAAPKSNTEWLARWRSILVQIKAAGINERTPLSSENLIEWLFDIDRLSAQVRLAGKSIRSHLDRPRSKKNKQLYRFVTSLLKIEFWLLGYEGIKPNGKAMNIKKPRQLVQGPRARAGARRPRGSIPVSGQNYLRIRDFLEGRGNWDDRLSVGTLLTRCFDELASMQEPEKDDPNNRQQRANHLIEKIDANRGEVELKWNAKSFVSRMWDGVKRVWRFFKHLVSKVVDGIKMLVRAGRQLAAEGLSLLRRGIRVFSDGLHILLERELRGSNQYVAVARDRDFDFQVFLNRSAASDHINEFFMMFDQRILRLRASIRILSLMVHVALTVLTLPFASWRWWRLIQALVTFNSVYDEEDRLLIGAAVIG